MCRQDADLTLERQPRFKSVVPVLLDMRVFGLALKPSMCNRVGPCFASEIHQITQDWWRLSPMREEPSAIAR